MIEEQQLARRDARPQIEPVEESAAGGGSPVTAPHHKGRDLGH
jgi:hypothetical protein